ncbi:TIGR03943 family putative permease subunit [Erysipelatoclostridium sp. AM42-17]|uniref:TIGR03943 family putative permease subunit n=1 Tax=Erysipelatoclostridium sp. AM42-17 TaxID=2293102 RepID=UPI000E535403|nr:GTP-binding protein [Erysipelatoclostridium sp. AM42-17]RHS91942.1 hypothetical protein DW911_09385 [Erysipelatoclostridium sp. AM42-17]
MENKVRVYLFTGFLESGKTSFIQDTVLNDDFHYNEKTLILSCEEGVEAYNEETLKKADCDVVYVDDESTITPDYLSELNQKYHPTQVMVEYNGMWNSQEFIHEKCIDPWMVVQVLTTINAETFDIYYNNMRSQFVDHVTQSDLVIINRCDKNTKKYVVRGSIKSLNPRAQIIYENKNHQIENITSDDLPYQLSDEYIEIKDMDYGIFCMDIMEHPENYENKTLKLKAQVIGRDKILKNGFVFGRQAMVCCSEDTQLLGLVCVSPLADKLIPHEWLTLEGTIAVEFDDSIQSQIPILYVDKIEPAKPLDNDYVTFD